MSKADNFDTDFRELNQNINKRSKLYWAWYKQNCFLGVFSKITTTVLTALLIGDASLREFSFYPDKGLISILAILVSVFVNLEIWWNPWSKRKMFLIKGQRLKSLSINSKADFLNCQNETEKAEFIKKLNDEYITILREAIEENKY